MRNTLILLGILLSSLSFASEVTSKLGINKEGKLLALCAVKEDEVRKDKNFNASRGFALIQNDDNLYICDTMDKIYLSTSSKKIEVGPYSFKYVVYTPEKPYWVCGYLSLNKNKVIVNEENLSSEIVIENVLTFNASTDERIESTFESSFNFILRNFSYFREKNISKYQCENISEHVL